MAEKGCFAFEKRGLHRLVLCYDQTLKIHTYKQSLAQLAAVCQNFSPEATVAAKLLRARPLASKFLMPSGVCASFVFCQLGHGVISWPL